MFTILGCTSIKYSIITDVSIKQSLTLNGPLISHDRLDKLMLVFLVFLSEVEYRRVVIIDR